MHQWNSKAVWARQDRPQACAFHMGASAWQGGVKIDMRYADASTGREWQAAWPHLRGMIGARRRSGRRRAPSIRPPPRVPRRACRPRCTRSRTPVHASLLSALFFSTAGMRLLPPRLSEVRATRACTSGLSLSQWPYCTVTILHAGHIPPRGLACRSIRTASRHARRPARGRSARRRSRMRGVGPIVQRRPRAATTCLRPRRPCPARAAARRRYSPGRGRCQSSRPFTCMPSACVHQT